jgi:hypothetical protein
MSNKPINKQQTLLCKSNSNFTQVLFTIQKEDNSSC